MAERLVERRGHMVHTLVGHQAREPSVELLFSRELGKRGAASAEHRPLPFQEEDRCGVPLLALSSVAFVLHTEAQERDQEVEGRKALLCRTEQGCDIPSA